MTSPEVIVETAGMTQQKVAAWDATGWEGVRGGGDGEGGRAGGHCPLRWGY